MELMFTSMRKMVTRSAIRPGTLSTGTTNPMKAVVVSSPVGTYVVITNGIGILFMVTLKPLRDMPKLEVVSSRGPKVRSNISVLLLADLKSIDVRKTCNQSLDDGIDGSTVFTWYLVVDTCSRTHPEPANL